MKQSRWLQTLPAYLLIPLAGGFISSWLSGDIKEVYSGLNLPFFAPPSWLFAPVWIVLYLMIGLGAYLISKSGELSGGEKESLLKIFWIQLAMNFLWSPLFFRFRWGGMAFFLLLLMIFLVGVLLVKVKRPEKLIFLLFLPYFVWLCFAAVLNFSINLLN